MKSNLVDIIAEFYLTADSAQAQSSTLHLIRKNRCYILIWTLQNY